MEDYLEENYTLNKPEENLVNVYVEIEQFSNIKYEYNKETNHLEIDRLLSKPYVYPYAYGFIVNTLAEDGDELDILIVSDHKKNTYTNDSFYNVYIIGALDMEDEKGRDPKILCVSKEEYVKIKDINDLTDTVKNNIYRFFTNYKNDVPGKWSKVTQFINKHDAVKLYKESKL
uniref:inorganic diphosphatase n=1 Tax=viral metagenome TaxID=1070528 RepID=A0A6C0E2P6_9ZZZZ